jgi:hypothetical protein
LPNSTCPGDYKQPLLDETFSHMLFYAESPSMVDLGRAEKLFRTIDSLLKSGLGRQVVSCMLFTNLTSSGGADHPPQKDEQRASIGGGRGSTAPASQQQQLIEFMARHYRHIQGDGFWDWSAHEKEEGGPEVAMPSENRSQKFSTLFEVFSTVLFASMFLNYLQKQVVLYFFRSYFLNSPLNYVREDDLVLAWKCKVV